MDVATRRSTSGGVIFLNGGPITWSSKLQKIVAMSTAEAEIIAATDVTKEIVHLRHLLQELGVRDDAPIQVHEDNQACILMGNGMKSSRAAKHYEVRLHFLQESIRSNIIKFKYCPTDDMIADCLTKPLDVDKFIAFRDQLLHTPG
jgi:biopolymer transport protein ExbB/TolQ